MSLKITRNGISIDFVKEDFNITDVNNSFSRSFYSPHSDFPMRILENQNTIAALGEFSLVSKTKKKFFEVKLHVGMEIYNAELEQQQLLGNFRKCNIRVVDEIKAIMHLPIWFFMQNINVQGNDPEDYPYSETTETPLNTWPFFAADVLARRLKIFPQTQYQYAVLRNEVKEWEDPEYEGDWKSYQKYLNKRDNDLSLLENDFEINDTVITVYNRNVVQPQVFVLAPIFNALASIGWKMKGSFVNDIFTKSLVFDSRNDQMSGRTLSLSGDFLTLDGLPWVAVLYDISPPNFFTWHKELEITPMPGLGNYKVKWRLNMAGSNNPDIQFGLYLKWQGAVLSYFLDFQPGEYQGEFTFVVEEGQINDTLEFGYHHKNKLMPLSYEFELLPDTEERVLYEPHPTIEWQRYLPGWNFGELVNNLKNAFNLKIDIDPIKKELVFQKNETDYLVDGKTVRLDESFELRPVENIPYESYVIKNENDFDGSLFIDSEGVVENKPPNDKTQELPRKFKHILFLNGNSQLFEDYKERDGVGLFLYSPNIYGRTTGTVDGRHLRISGAGGIHDVYFKTWIKFLLNGSPGKIVGVLSPAQLNVLIRHKKVYLNRQVFCISNLKWKILDNESYECSMDVVSRFF
tara:strand:- start:29750 stop:31642 length:1893 start_codon:yes stop_codon:yes gene_type:complete